MMQAQTGSKMPVLNISRRWFLAALGATAVATGFLTTGAAAVIGKTGGKGGFSPAVWYEIDGSGRVTVNIAKAEMGQHVGTALAMIVAEELDAKWDDVDIVQVDADPKWGYMITGGSWSVNQSYDMLARAGAAGRIALIEAGAQLLGVKPGQCTARESMVHCGNRSVSYGEIVARAPSMRTFTEDEMKAITLKPLSRRQLMGSDKRAIDIAGKVNGTAIYSIDRRVEGMVYARPILPPTRYGNSITAWSDKAARKVPGYIRTVQLDDPSGTCQGWLVVVATSWPSAATAAGLVEVSYKNGPAIGIDEEQLLAEGEKLVADPALGSIFYQSGDTEAALKAAGVVVDNTYRTSTVLHMQMEPISAVAWEEGGKWHIHAGDQHPSNSLPLVSKALGVEPSNIVLEASYLGGGFGRRLYCDFMVPAALTAKAIGRPVKLVFSRSDDVMLDQPRSPTVQRIRTSHDTSGKLTAYDYAGAAGWPTYSQAPGFMGDGMDGSGKFDAFAISGADHWYDAPNQKIRTIRNELVHAAFLPGYLRSVAAGYTAWAVETHIDEVAHRLKRDPAEYRLLLLGAEGRNAGEGKNDVGGAHRMQAVLQRAMEKAGWARRGSLPKGEGMGVALGGGQERTMPTWSATIAHVAVDSASGQITVKRLTNVFDAGVLVHPDGALAQVEGGVLWGLSMALHEGSRCEGGRAADLNFDTYSPVRIGDVPPVDIEFIRNDHMPVGLGEPGVIAVAPAIGNAIFHATGARVRDLPIRAEAVLKAMGGHDA